GPGERFEAHGAGVAGEEFFVAGQQVRGFVAADGGDGRDVGGGDRPVEPGGFERGEVAEVAAEADPPAGRATGQAACVAEPLGGALGPVGDVPACGVERADGAGGDRFHLGEVAVEGDDRVGVG